MVRKVLLYLWQLPQNILGLLVIFFTKSVYYESGCWVTPDYRFGVSLGNYIIFGGRVDEISLKHEQGHQKQSLYLDWLYLLIIGLPSAIGNIYDRIAHKNWSYKERERWYYAQPWEAWADRLGGVAR